MSQDGANIELVGPWKSVKDFFRGARSQKRFATEFKKAQTFNGEILVVMIKRAIREARAHGPANASLTLALRKEAYGIEPLRARGWLHDAITYKLTGWQRLQVGIIPGSGKNKNRPGLIKAAQIVHDGKRIPVTDKMRGFFDILARATSPDREWRMRIKEVKSRRARQLISILRGKGITIRPLRTSKREIVIPPRPFIEWAFKYTEELEKIGHNFAAALINVYIPPEATFTRGSRINYKKAGNE